MDDDVDLVAIGHCEMDAAVGRGPVEREDWKALRRGIRREIRDHLGKPSFTTPTMIGSGGTFSALAAMSQYERYGEVGTTHGYVLSQADLVHLLDRLRETPLKQRKQIRGLMDGGADVIWAETISSEEEFRAVAEAAEAEAAPFCGTLSFDTAGRTMMGVTSSGFAGIAGSLDQPPMAFGANCGTGAPDLLRTVLGLTEADGEAIVIAKANAGIPKYVDGQIEYDGTPDLMARYACLARDAGARLIGGCCGTKPEHLVAMKAALEKHEVGARPSLERIVQEIGPFTSESDGTGADAVDSGARTRGRRGRRR